MVPWSCISGKLVDISISYIILGILPLPNCDAGVRRQTTVLTTLRLFGAPQFTLDDTLVRFENRKVTALLSYCAVSGQAHSRERLAALLWPETDQALAALRTTLWEVRKKLDPELLVVSRQDVQLPPSPELWCDIHEYLALMQAAASPALEAMQRVELLQQASDLYQDGFLSGFSLRDSSDYDDWQRTQTAHFQRLQHRMLTELSERYIEVGNIHSAIMTGERLRAMDTLAEAPVLRLMRLYIESGQAQTAMRLYQEYTALLERELGAAPSPALTALHDTLLRPNTLRRTVEESAVQRARSRPVAGAQAVGSPNAVFYRSALTVLGRPRQFVGRRRLVERALTGLEQGDAVLLTGMGGIGKTAAAADISARYLERSGQPVLWLEAGFQNARELFLALARAFGQAQAAQAVPNPASLIMEMLAGHSGLLVLDNCWNASALFEVLAAVPHGMPVLVTSRQRIPLDGEVLTVDRLHADDARALLAYHARRELPPGPAVNELLALLGCHPFALEIAGKQLKTQPALSPADLCARYARGTHEIAVPAGFAEAERQSIDRVIGASVAEVSAPALALLTAAGGLAAPRISMEMLALLLDEAPEGLERTTGELEQASLVEIGRTGEQAWLRMHDLMYRYCRDLFRASPGDLRPLVRAAAGYLGEHAADAAAAESEYPNLEAALRAAQQMGDGDALVAMMRALMQGYYGANGCSDGLREHLEAAVNAAHDRGAGDGEALHALLTYRADMHAMQGRPEDAYQDEVRALACAPTLKRRVALTTRLAESAYALGQPEYRAYLDDAERQARAHGLHSELCAVLVQRGMICSYESEWATARALFTEALAAATQAPEPTRRFEALYNLSIAEIELGEIDAAEAHLAQGRELAERERNRLWLGSCDSGLGRCAHARGQREHAGRLLNAALREYRRVKWYSAAEWVRDFLTEHQYEVEAEEDA